MNMKVFFIVPNWDGIFGRLSAACVSAISLELLDLFRITVNKCCPVLISAPMCRNFISCVGY
jgi:hypothetical protein